MLPVLLVQAGDVRLKLLVHACLELVHVKSEVGLRSQVELFELSLYVRVVPDLTRYACIVALFINGSEAVRRSGLGVSGLSKFVDEALGLHNCRHPPLGAELVGLLEVHKGLLLIGGVFGGNRGALGSGRPYRSLDC